MALDAHPSFTAPTLHQSPPTTGIAATAPISTGVAAWPISGIDDAEKIDWYNEYKFRHAPLKMRWFCAGTDRADVEVGLADEVKGLSTFSSASGGAASGGENDMLLSSVSDGSICIWSLKDTAAGRGRRVVARSKAGLVFSDRGDEKWRSGRKARDAEIVDGVSVDDVTGRVWVAGEEGLIEIVSAMPQSGLFAGEHTDLTLFAGPEYASESVDPPLPILHPNTLPDLSSTSSHSRHNGHPSSPRPTCCRPCIHCDPQW